MGLEGGEPLAPMETDEPSGDPKGKGRISPAMAARIKQIKPLLSGMGGTGGSSGVGFGVSRGDLRLLGGWGWIGGSPWGGGWIWGSPGGGGDYGILRGWT